MQEFVLFWIMPLLVELGSAATYLTVVYGFSLTATVICTGLAYVAVILYSRDGSIHWRTEMNEQGDQVDANKNEAISQIDIVKYFSAETVSC